MVVPQRLMGAFSFSKIEKLLNREEFVNLNRSGRRHHTRHFVLIFKKNGLSFARLGITVSKKIGNAVQRNRVKRLIREFFRLHRDHFPKGFDFVIAAKRNAISLNYSDLTEELSEGLTRRDFSI
jgi:ribonuclease P protein component